MNDPVIGDVFIEFLEVAFHQLLYLSGLYPREVFEERKKYGTAVKYSIHPEINSYLSDCLRSADVLRRMGQLQRVAFRLLDPQGVELSKFIFEVHPACESLTEDHYLIRCESGLRALCYRLAAQPLPLFPEGSTFEVLLHTVEAAAVKLAKRPELERFPFVEADEESARGAIITPVESVRVNDAVIQVYMERKDDND